MIAVFTEATNGSTNAVSFVTIKRTPFMLSAIEKLLLSILLFEFFLSVFLLLFVKSSSDYCWKGSAKRASQNDQSEILNSGATDVTLSSNLIFTPCNTREASCNLKLKFLNPFLLFENKKISNSHTNVSILVYDSNLQDVRLLLHCTNAVSNCLSQPKKNYFISETLLRRIVRVAIINSLKFYTTFLQHQSLLRWIQ